MFPFGDSSIKYYSLFVIHYSLLKHEEMKKEYIEPTMRVANLKHKYHLLQSSAKPNIYQLSDKPFGTYDDDDDEIVDDDDVI